MITLCWAAKGGSGTTVVAAALALARSGPSLLVDLAGDQPAVFGISDGRGPGVLDWIASSAPADRIGRLETSLTPDIALLAAGAPIEPLLDHASRWHDVAQYLQHDRRDVIVDAGTGVPPLELQQAATHRWLVTRPCYLALRAAARSGVRPTGVVLVTEPGRVLRRSDVELSLGAPVVAELPLDPAVARAVDSGLLAARLPRLLQHELRAAA